ncbi:unnamed protein product [Cylindrotheca closterium]|uniref:Uncharacterized protein n=1 Tax=Cylindrotheca closterium TaxID=2856 RepID=A0AAD2CQN9_9STRA|nr:unnamed protein product [Cylindrotheca closterium]
MESPKIRRVVILYPLLLANVICGRQICIDVGSDQFSCTHDFFATRYQVDGSTIDVGVTQRIDGSEIEKAAIREVLARMDSYFFNEVLAMPEYEYARPRCSAPFGVLSGSVNQTEFSCSVTVQLHAASACC